MQKLPRRSAVLYSKSPPYVQYFAAVSGLGGKSLVYLIPDATALQDGYFDDVPVILEVTQAVPHGMGRIRRE